MTVSLYSVTLKLPAGLDDDWAGSLISMPGEWMLDGAPLAASAGREGMDHRGGWVMQWLFDGAPDLDSFATLLTDAALQADIPDLMIAANDLTLAEVPQENWLEKTYHAFPPFRESGFYIYGSHVETPEPGADIPLLIDAVTAFGSGEHGTTAGCLAQLSALKSRGFDPQSVLDLGTGSGILAIAAWKLWNVPVLATDIDPESIVVTESHRALNDVPADALPCVVSDGFESGALKDRAFDLTIANILAGPLRELSDGIIGCTKPGGYILLSGMLGEQGQEIAAFYKAKGCVEDNLLMRGDWAALLLRKP